MLRNCVRKKTVVYMLDGFLHLSTVKHWLLLGGKDYIGVLVVVVVSKLQFHDSHALADAKYKFEIIIVLVTESSHVVCEALV